MPETVAAWIATNTLTATSFLTATQITALTYTAFAAATLGYGDYQRRKARERQRAAFNASVQDRLVMQATVQGARSRVYGRARNVDGVLFKQTHGANKEFYTLVIALAGHEVDAIEQVWFNDQPVTLDGAGNVTTAPWAVANRQQLTATMTVSGGAGSVVLPSTPLGTPVAVFGVAPAGFSIDFGQDVTHPGSLVGSTFSVTGAPRDGTWTVMYEVEQTESKARVRRYTGAPGQNLYSDLQSLVGSAVQTSDRFEGIAALLVTLQYDQDAFPSGVPSISAVMRGARVFDPRTSTTAWTENPALIARDWSLYAQGGGCVASEINEPAFAAAANACDVSTAFALPTGGPVVLPLYQCGIVIPLDSNPDEALSEVCESMAGQWGWAGGKLTVRAGVYRAPVASVTEDWLSGADDIRISPGPGQAEAINIMRPTYADAAQGWVETPGAEVRADSYVAADGRELVRELPLGGVTRSVHAQHVCGVLLREAREGLTLELPCNLRAYPLELFDVVSVTLPRFGFSGKPFEVVGWRFTLTGGVMLTLRETAAAIFTPDAVFDLLNTSPNTGLPAPARPPALTGLAATSGGVAQLDGSSLARIRVTWDPVASEAVRQSGSIELQVAEVQPGLPSGDWPTVTVLAGRAVAADLFGQRIDRLAAIRARCINTLGQRGPWRQITHLVSGRRAPVVWRQASAPSGSAVQDGDEWVDTDDSNRRYVREGGAWVDVRDAGIAAALTAAAAAQATADGKIDTFWQPSAPGSAAEGDIWFDTDDGFKQYRYTSGSWVLAADTRIGTAISNAATAQATADGKVRTFIGGSAPTAEALGDLWLDTANGNRLNRWSGSAWVAVPVGTGAIGANAATEIVHQYVDDVTVSRDAVVGPGVFYPNYYALAEGSWANTTGAAVLVEVTVDGGAQRTAGDATCWLSCDFGLNPPPSLQLPGPYQYRVAELNDANIVRASRSLAISVPAGQTVYARVAALIDVPTVATSVVGRECAIRITVVKR